MLKLMDPFPAAPPGFHETGFRNQDMSNRSPSAGRVKRGQVTFLAIALVGAVCVVLAGLAMMRMGGLRPHLPGRGTH